jgi:hypothetical protein
MAPLIEKSEETLAKNKKEQQAIRDLIIRFDEILSTKISRESLNDLEVSLKL